MLTGMEYLSYMECLKRQRFNLEKSDIGKVSKEGIFSVCCTLRMRRYSIKCLSNDFFKTKEKKKKKKQEKKEKKAEHLFFP